MKRLLLFLLFLPVVFALDCSSLDPTTLGAVNIDYSASGNINIDFESEHSLVENLNANIRVVPQTSLGTVSYTGTLGTDEFDNTILNFYQETVTTSPVPWLFESSLSYSTTNVKIPINPVFPYPLNDFPENIQSYVEFTEVADTSVAIQEKANELVSGVTDYFTAISEIANFVAYFLEYNLIYAPSSVAASQVFQQQSGVCDEFSSLLISMLRNVGIPSRFVSGFAYTNVGGNTCTNFGPHSWTEVYVPDYGWIQIDSTYKEFFWIDAGHVPLYTSNDAGTSIINASVVYIDASLSTEAPTFDIELLDYSEPTQDLEFTATTFPETVGEADYILLNVSVTNPYNEWVLDTLFMSTTSEIQIVYNNKSIPIVLPPNSVTSFYFILLTPDNLDEGYIYTHPVVVGLGSGGEKSLSIEINPALIITNYYDSFMNTVSSSNRQYSSNLAILNKEILPNRVVDEEPLLGFDIQNIGNTILSDVVIVIDYENIHYSQNIGDMYIGETYSYSKVLELPDTTGLIDVGVEINSENLSVPFSTSFTVVAQAPFDFSTSGDTEYTSENDYSLDLYFSSIPSNYVSSSLLVEINNITVISRPFYFSESQVSLSSDYFISGENTIKTTIEYVDSQGNDYLTNSELIIARTLHVGIIDSILQFFEAIMDIFKILLGIE